LKQDLLFSLGAFMTVCKIDRNEAEGRLQKVLLGEVDPGAEVQTTITVSSGDDSGSDSQEVIEIDIEDVALDGITTRLIEVFQSHQLAELVRAILETRGLTCVVSPPGPDKGIDIIAGSGPLGLDSPRIVVQCKSSDGPVDTGVVQRLQGALATIGAEQALLVAFGGVNKQAKELLVNQQFKVKVWDAKDLVKEFLNSYPSLSAEIREALPLKQIWTLASTDE
jgi:restriction system protein